MIEPENYATIAKLLREQAGKPGLPKAQASKAISLAEYFEALIVDPGRDLIPGGRYG